MFGDRLKNTGKKYLQKLDELSDEELDQKIKLLALSQWGGLFFGAIFVVIGIFNHDGYNMALGILFMYSGQGAYATIFNIRLYQRVRRNSSTNRVTRTK